jgi:hypothetical protein
MPDLADLLERQSQSVDREPGGLDRLVRRRARRERNRRVGAAALALLVTVAAIAAVIRAGGDTERPAGPSLSVVSPPPPGLSGLALRSAVCFHANKAQRAITADARMHPVTQRVSATIDDIQAFAEAIAPLSRQIPALHGPVQKRTEELLSDGIRVATWDTGLSSPVREFTDFSRSVTRLSTEIASFCGPTS